MSDVPPQVIGELPLPSALVEAIMAGRWRAPEDPGKLRAVFPEDPVRPVFLQINGMIRENAGWHGEEDPSVREQYLGSPSVERPPGDIDPTLSLLIGFLGPDQHFALDYRKSGSRPSVVYLTTYDGWVEISSDIESLLDSLGLSD